MAHRGRGRAAIRPAIPTAPGSLVGDRRDSLHSPDKPMPRTDRTRAMLRAGPLGALLGLSLLWSCAPSRLAPADDPDPAPESALGRYFRARGLDLVDIVSVRLSLGPGLLAHARATKWIALGVGSLGPATSWGLGFAVQDHVLGWGLREGGLWTERRGEIGISTFYYCEAEVEVIAGRRDDIGLLARGPWDVGAEAHLALVGLALDFRPDQVLDFIAGLIGNDPMGDDPGSLSEPGR